VALKQRKAKPGFQRGDFTAYRALGEVQRARRMGEIKVASRDQKGFQRI